MKKLFLIIILSGFYYSASKSTYSKTAKADPIAIGSYPEACSSKDLINETKEMLKPDFIYDGFKLIKVRLKDKPHTRQIIMPLYQEVKYKFVFNRGALPKGSAIKVYRGRSASADQLQFSSDDFDTDENLLVYEPVKDIGSLNIEFNIPAASEGAGPGCVCVVGGYKL